MTNPCVAEQHKETLTAVIMVQVIIYNVTHSLISHLHDIYIYYYYN